MAPGQRRNRGLEIRILEMQGAVQSSEDEPVHTDKYCPGAPSGWGGGMGDKGIKGYNF